MGGLEVVFRCHAVQYMFYVLLQTANNLQKIMMCTHMHLSLFWGNLITINFHDNIDRWTDFRRIMMASGYSDN